jgi:hypothetical protein
MSLSRLAQLALSAASESPPSERAEVCRLVASALHDDCPDLAHLALQAASHFHSAAEAEQDLLSRLTDTN